MVWSKKKLFAAVICVAMATLVMFLRAVDGPSMANVRRGLRVSVVDEMAPKMAIDILVDDTQQVHSQVHANPADTDKSGSLVDIMLDQRLRQLPNVESSLVEDGIVNDVVRNETRVVLGNASNTNIPANVHLSKSTSRKVSILFWTSFHNRQTWWYFKEAPIRIECGKCRCDFTYSKSRLKIMDAVLFEFSRRLIKKGADKLDLPRIHPPEQYWVLYNHEAPKLSSSRVYEKLNGGIFNLSATYKTEADISLKYGECLSRTERRLSKASENYAEKKTGLVVWHVSHCITPSKRMEYVTDLQKYITVDIKGLCTGRKKKQFSKSKVHFGEPTTTEAVENINKYKFYLSFENTYCDQYITEKVFKILLDDIMVIPVVRGAGPYKDYLPPHSYIDADDFSSAKALAEYLHLLDKNDTLYNGYFKSRHNFECFNFFGNSLKWPCAVCNGICSRKQEGIKETLNDGELENLYQASNLCEFPRGGESFDSED